MKAIICSIDGVPSSVAVVNEDGVGELPAQLRQTQQYDRVDVVAVDTAADLLADARANAAADADPDVAEGGDQ